MKNQQQWLRRHHLSPKASNDLATLDWSISMKDFAFWYSVNIGDFF